jgi:hypothetical protein
MATVRITREITYEYDPAKTKHLHVNDEGDEIELEIRSKKVVCWQCRGEGTHVDPAIDGHGITQEEMDRLGPEFLEDYLRGMFDVPCQECNGLRVLDEPDPEDPNYALWEQDMTDEADYRAEREAEMRAGC